MANSDYVVAGEPALLCPVAQLAGELAALATQAGITGFSGTGPNDVVPGMAIMIGDEICRLTAKSGNLLEIRRGCGDTIPRAHPAGTLVWFFGQTVGTDGQEWGGTQTVAVKVLPSTASGGRVPVGGSPPNDLTFDSRFIRPYPPGNVTVNSDPWIDPVTISEEAGGITLAWAHRDRVAQADQLIAHESGSIGPEPGTTYRVRIFDGDDELLKEYAGITADTWAWGPETASLDTFTSEGSTLQGYILLDAERDGYFSLDAYRVDFTLNGMGEARDPFWDNVALLLTGDEVSAEMDKGPAHRIASALTDVASVSEGVHFGTGVLKRTVSPGVGISFASSAELSVSGNWTLEFFITPTVAQQGYIFGASGTRYMSWSAGQLTLNGYGTTFSFATPVNERRHIAISRIGNTIRGFLNGVLTATTPSAAVVNSPTSGLAIFGIFGRADLPPLRGLLEEIRLTVGVGRYNADTPPEVILPTDPYPINPEPEAP